MNYRETAIHNASVAAVEGIRPVGKWEFTTQDFEEFAKGGTTPLDAVEYAKDFARDLATEGIRFEDEHVDEPLAYGAISFAFLYTGTFEYVLDIRSKFLKFGSLSKGQIRGLLNVIRAEVQKEKRDEEDFAFRETLTNVIALFTKAHEAGLKTPRVRFVVGDTKCVIYPAAAHSKNAGSYYVKEQAPYGEGEYYGKVSSTGEVDSRLESNASVVAALRSLDANPEEAIARYGRETGNCGICGRTLTDKSSIERGIGPVCADKFGL